MIRAITHSTRLALAVSVLPSVFAGMLISASEAAHPVAARWSAEGLAPTVLVDRLYEQALCRKPTATERQTALQMVGTPVRKEGVEDLLWALAMLPEFQLIY